MNDNEFQVEWFAKCARCRKAFVMAADSSPVGTVILLDMVIPQMATELARFVKTHRCEDPGATAP